jgi:protein SCO1
METPGMTKVYAWLAVAVTSAFLGWSAYNFWVKPRLADASADPFVECRKGQVAGGAIGGPFSLKDQNGATVSEKDVLTKPALIYFGYTFCPDVCPLDMARNVEAVDILEERGFEVKPVFISIDPERDTPEALADYAANLHPRLIALTGTPDQVRTASQAYKTYYKRRETGDEFYLMDHSTFTYLILPGFGFAEFYKQEVTPDQMADSASCFLEAAQAAE